MKRLVEDQPVQAELAHRLDELLKSTGLRT